MNRLTHLADDGSAQMVDVSAKDRSAREAVESWIQKTKGAPDDQIEQSIRSYLAFVTKQYEAAAKHAQRKSSE